MKYNISTNPDYSQFFCIFRQLLLQIVVLFAFFGFSQAQSKDKLSEYNLFLKVGDKVPEEFWTQKHLFFLNGDTIRIDLSKYKGKLLVLDFWSTTCASCIFHHKEIDFFQSTYQKDISVIKVNPLKTKDNLNHILDFYGRHYTLEDGSKKEFSSIILDDQLQQIFQFSGYPHYIWINKHGYIQTQTFRNFLDRNYVAPFIDIE